MIKQVAGFEVGDRIRYRMERDDDDCRVFTIRAFIVFDKKEDKRIDDEGLSRDHFPGRIYADVGDGQVVPLDEAERA